MRKTGAAMLFGGLLMVTFGAGGVPSDAEARVVLDPFPADSGYYTVEQAERGNEVWDEGCVECHELWEVRGEDFMFEWEGSSVGRLYRVISRTMPDDNAGSLPQEDYFAVVAYILQLNDFPAGEVALGSDIEALDSLMIEP